ncbi:hypothetical protein AB0G02_00425 [Actinosynnema sp. NPDC023658]|uniref:hypothetical protein n=1 Tax=Actinosynnema sp. NPDC023658 TaxID=3155465 RepID=UPI0033D2FC7A
MVGKDLELLITAVVAADDEQQARAACAALLHHSGGQVVRATDCSDEEPGCWSVTISGVSGERVTQNVAGALARAVRTFVRQLGDEFPTPRVACEPPTAWTVLEDPALLDDLVPGAERLLVEAWAGGDPQQRPRQDDPPQDHPHRDARRPDDSPAGPHADHPTPDGGHTPRHHTTDVPPRTDSPRHRTPDPRHRAADDRPNRAAEDRHRAPDNRPNHTPDDPHVRPDDTPTPERPTAARPEPASRLSLRVDVATDRSAGAEWQARAVASRIARSGKITRVAPRGHLLSVHIDLGSSVNSPTVALHDAVASLGRSGWSEVAWTGGTGSTRWSATPVPPTGIAALELTATPASAFVWTVPD